MSTNAYKLALTLIAIASQLSTTFISSNTTSREQYDNKMQESTKVRVSKNLNLNVAGAVGKTSTGKDKQCGRKTPVLPQ